MNIEEVCKITKLDKKELLRRLDSCVVSSFEGGSNYWASAHSRQKPTNYDNKKLYHYGNWEKELINIEKGRLFLSDYVMNDGGWLEIRDCEYNGDDEIGAFTPVKLNFEMILKGLMVMKDKYPRHYKDIVGNYNADAITGDVLVQCAMFDEIVFG